MGAIGACERSVVSRSEEVQFLIKAAEDGPPIEGISGPDRAMIYEMIRQDLAAARRAWIAKAEDDPKGHRRRQRSDFLAYRNHAGLYADFHSIRHTVITNLCKADVSFETAQLLARHSDIQLTMEVYAHVDQSK